MTGEDDRRRLRRGIPLGLLALTLLAAAVVASPAQADPQFAGGCKVQLTGEPPGPLGPSNNGELTFDCTQFKVAEVSIQGSVEKDFLVAPLAPGGAGAFLCVPGGTSEATCQTAPPGQPDGSFTILAKDICGIDDNIPLVVAVALAPPEGVEAGADFTGLKIQCEAAPPTTTPTTPAPTPTTAQSAPPSGTAEDTGGGSGGGSGAVRGAEDSGQVPQGGVQSGAGGTAPADDGGAGLLAAAVGLMLAATLGLWIARVRSVKE